jgi:hypothetical protein
MAFRNENPGGLMHKQRGVTMIGWIFLLVPIAIVGYAALRVGPEYFNFYKLSKALTDAAKQLETDDALNAQTIRRAIERRFDTGYIDEPSVDTLIISKGEEGKWQVQADYEKTVPVFGNLYLTMSFDKTVVIN